MNTFSAAVVNQTTTTENGMQAFASTADALVDLFGKIGASRGKDIMPDFIAAFAQDQELAVRIALWARDVREGAGERETFRKILKWLSQTNRDLLFRVLPLVPKLGRWDDLFIFNDAECKKAAYGLVRDALLNNDGLCAKWCPREKSAKNDIAAELIKFLGWTPKFYRKRLVELTKVVETQMCANKWDDINFSHVPSMAHKRYRSAFQKHTPKYAEYVGALSKGDTSVKINAGAIFPYDLLPYNSYYGIRDLNEVQRNSIIAQWDALPNYIGSANVLPLVDVSGSMDQPAGKNTRLTCMAVAISLGLYFADKNKGKFKDTFLTFSSEPQLLHLKGNVLEKFEQMIKSDWGMSTDLHKAIQRILDVAIQGNVPNEEMPKMLLILSDMQFNYCVVYNDRALDMIRRKYEQAGYTMPQVVFWQLNAKDNVPVQHNENGVALVSGFSAAITKSLLETDGVDFTPTGVMMKTIMKDRYSF